MGRRATVACLFAVVLLLACHVGAPTPPAAQAASAQGPPPAQALAAIAACPPSPIPNGIYTKTITATEAKAYAKSHQLDYVGLGLGFIVGSWTWGIGAPGPNCFHNSWFVLRKHGQVVFVDEHPYTVEGPDRIAVHGAQEPVGLYLVRTRPGSVRMIGLSDWPVRKMVHEIGSWTLQKGGPVKFRAALVCGAVLLTTCTSGGRLSSTSPALNTGGTLRVGMRFDAVQNLDPDKEYASSRNSPVATWELFRCCLLRTLYSYRGLPTDRGGTTLMPDLAVGHAVVSSDGLTWTIQIKQGIRYAPPLEDTRVTAQDFVRALLREANRTASGVFAYSAYYSVIQGFDDVANGRADAISGVVVPDPETLEIHLTRPTGDLGYRLSLPATAPIPPNPYDPTAPLGIAQGQDAGFGRFLVGTGPYMLAGSAALDFSKPALLQPGIAGYRPNESITLIRNPSWRRSTDDLRPALVDRIDIQIASVPITPISGLPQELTPLVGAGGLDLVLDESPLPTDANSSNAQVDPSNQLTYATMNMATPPFDDLHVRKAVNFVVDKEALLRLARAEGSPSDIATHTAPDSLEGGLLATMNPYPTSVRGAKREMRASPYDRNGDGICDAPSCRRVKFVDFASLLGQASSSWTPIVRRSLALIGIHLAAYPTPYVIDAPSEKIPFEFGPLSVWYSDYPDASTFFEALFSSRSIRTTGSFRTVNYNVSLMGARPAELRKWGYNVTRVPSVDDRIRACDAQTGTAGSRCWAQLDQYLMENVVPIVPILTSETVRLVSARVRGYSIDQFTGLPALDRIWLQGGSS